MSTIYNPSLRQTRRSDLAPILPMRKNSSILDWLEGTGRLLDRETKEASGLTPEEDEEEITALMGADDAYDDDDDDLDDSMDD